VRPQLSRHPTAAFFVPEQPEADPASIAALYRHVRRHTEALAAPLSAEDQTIQSMPDASPTKWHRAHTTWFFETFVLTPFDSGYVPYDPAFGYLFNSYYEAVGPRHPRPMRGLLTRPGAEAVTAYRAHVDAAMERLIASSPMEAIERIVLGLHHEQQHQELLLTDIKHAFHCNPTFPAYAAEGFSPQTQAAAPHGWLPINGGVHSIGHGATRNVLDFSFDNETPAHQVLLRDFAIADRPVSNGEFRAFIEDGGYRRPELWLSEGWSTAQMEGWEAPAYWHRRDRRWLEFTLRGLQPLRDEEPVCHVSFFEAAAYAEWAEARLPTEFEWEVTARELGAARLFGDVWEWTASPYAPYPGYRPQSGALGEYNGKFMINQMVLRGRSFATPPGHERLTYRNFFPPAARWQFSGFRLARLHHD
jgi:ergothioneine biosynthesis protein EgtB